MLAWYEVVAVVQGQVRDVQVCAYHKDIEQTLNRMAVHSWPTAEMLFVRQHYRKPKGASTFRVLHRLTIKREV